LDVMSISRSRSMRSERSVDSALDCMSSIGREPMSVAMPTAVYAPSPRLASQLCTASRTSRTQVKSVIPPKARLRAQTSAKRSPLAGRTPAASIASARPSSPNARQHVVTPSVVQTVSSSALGTRAIEARVASRKRASETLTHTASATMHAMRNAWRPSRYQVRNQHGGSPASHWAWRVAMARPRHAPNPALCPATWRVLRYSLRTTSAQPHAAAHAIDAAHATTSARRDGCGERSSAPTLAVSSTIATVSAVGDRTSVKTMPTLAAKHASAIASGGSCVRSCSARPCARALSKKPRMSATVLGLRPLPRAMRSAALSMRRFARRIRALCGKPSGRIRAMHTRKADTLCLSKKSQCSAFGAAGEENFWPNCLE